MTYADLARSIEALGFHTSDEGYRLVCATRGGEWGLGGKSFWITKREVGWFVGTWTPRIYAVPDSEQLVKVIVDSLTTMDRTYDFPHDIKQKYGLREVSADDFWPPHHARG